MANVLALYGGVAADSTILNFKSLNVLWNRMLTDGADAVIWLEIDPDVFFVSVLKPRIGEHSHFFKGIYSHFIGI